MNEPVFSCLVYSERKSLDILRDGNMIGAVNEVNGEPVITWFADIHLRATIPFSAIEIVMDNWNFLQSSVNKEKSH